MLSATSYILDHRADQMYSCVCANQGFTGNALNSF